MSTLLAPKTISLTSAEGETKEFIISKFPAVQGREIVAKYPTANIPKLGDYKVSEEIMLKLMNFVAVTVPQGELRLSSAALVNNHVSDWELLAKIEMAMMEYNISFFRNGNLSNFLANLNNKITDKITETLMGLLVPSSPQEKQPSTNSEPSTL